MLFTRRTATRLLAHHLRRTSFASSCSSAPLSSTPGNYYRQQSSRPAAATPAARCLRHPRAAAAAFSSSSLSSSAAAAVDAGFRCNDTPPSSTPSSGRVKPPTVLSSSSISASRAVRGEKPILSSSTLVDPTAAGTAGTAGLPGLPHDLSPAETEKHVAAMQREIRSLYAREQYDEAIEIVVDLTALTDAFYGKDHPVSASSVNNHALLKRATGAYSEAVELFTMAVQRYENSVGRDHSSTATALHNLGLAYKSMYESGAHSGVEKLMLQDRAEEALKESLKRRQAGDDPDAATTMYVLAAVRSVQGHTKDARTLFVEAVDTLRAAHEKGDGGNSAATAARLATALNNYGYFLKSEATKAVAVAGQLEGVDGEYGADGELFDEALQHYTEAFELRKEHMGPKHVSTIVSMQNIAELLHAQGRTEDASVLQRAIVAIVEDEAED